MKIWRIAAVAVVAGLALFLISIVLKLLLVGTALFLLVRFVGPRLIGRAFGPVGPGNWRTPEIISIDNPGHRSAVYQPGFERIISIG